MSDTDVVVGDVQLRQVFVQIVVEMSVIGTVVVG